MICLVYMTYEQPLRNQNEQQILVESSQSDVYEFTDPQTGRQLVRKEMKKLPAWMEGRAPQEIARDKSRLYQMMKEYLGEYLPETHYIVSADTKGSPRVQIIQEKISGKTYTQIKKDNEWEPEYDTARRDIRDKLNLMSQDPRVDSDEMPDLYRVGEAYASTDNIMIDKDKKVWVVDW